MKMIRTAEDIKLITDVYEGRRESLVQFITNRIHDAADAEDMSQDVFLRLLEMQDMICRETVDGFIFAIARNLIIDYIRRKRYCVEISSYMFDTCSRSCEPSVEEKLHVRWILTSERKKVNSLPQRRKDIYYLSRYKDLSPAEIAERLNLSVRTVEKHLYLGRLEVRAYMKKVSCMD